MTYVHWENILADVGQAYKEWLRGENGMDGPGCIAWIDELQTAYLNDQDAVYFCRSAADFTLEETARLVGKAFGSAVGADAAMIAINDDNSRPELRAGLTGKLYAGPINSEVATTITFGSTREYAVMTMTGAQAKELAETGFDAAGDGDACQNIQLSMEDTGITVEYTLDGQTAVEMVKNAEGTDHPYDVVLLDWKMAGMDGIETARAIRELAHPMAKTIPIIAMTANAFAEDIQDALDAGMNAHVAKPIDMAVLEQTVRGVLEQS